MQKGSSLYVVKLADGTANFNVVVQNLLKLKFQKTDNGK